LSTHTHRQTQTFTLIMIFESVTTPAVPSCGHSEAPEKRKETPARSSLPLALWSLVTLSAPGNHGKPRRGHKPKAKKTQ
ncbi:hypothetical protein AMEX_G7395, partial [Astyanax mexicanus]